MGKFALLEEIGHGRLGKVYRAWQTDLARGVALRLLPADPGKFEEQFSRAAEVAANLAAPGVAALYEAGRDEAGVYLAVEYVEGTTIDKADLTLRESVAVVRDAALAVESAHARNIVHGGLCPHNILAAAPRTGSGDPMSSRRTLVMDFGLDRSAQGTEGKGAGYLSPEQAEGRSGGARSDVYSLGATLYALVAGRAPFDAETPLEALKKIAAGNVGPPSRFNPVIDGPLESVILKAMERDPGRRYPTAGPLAADLTRWLEGERPEMSAAVRKAPPAAVPASRHLPPALRGKTGAVIVASAAALALVIVLALIVARPAPPAKPALRPEDGVAKVESRPLPAPREGSTAIVKREETPPPGLPEPKPSPPARVVAITVHSEPAGARVRVDGRPAGSAPLTLYRDEVGDRSVMLEVELEGYVPWRQLVRPSDGPREIQASLARTAPPPVVRPEAPAEGRVAILTRPAVGRFRVLAGEGGKLLGEIGPGDPPLRVPRGPVLFRFVPPAGDGLLREFNEKAQVKDQFELKGNLYGYAAAASEEKGETEAAVRGYTKVLEERDPPLSEADARRRLPERIRNLYQAWVESARKEGKTLAGDLLKEVDAARGNPPRLISIYVAANGTSSSRGAAAVGLALTHARLKRPYEAMEWYERAVAEGVDPGREAEPALAAASSGYPGLDERLKAAAARVAAIRKRAEERPPVREEVRPRSPRLGLVLLVHPQYGVFVKLDPGVRVSAGDKLEVVRKAEVVGELTVDRVTPAEREYPHGCAVCRSVKGAVDGGDDVRQGKK